MSLSQKIGTTPADDNKLDIEVVVPFCRAINFWRSLDIPLINCEIEFGLSWWGNCVISEISRTAAVAANPTNPTNRATEITGAMFKIKSTKLIVPAGTLPMSDNIKFFENIKQGFNRTIS